MKLFRAFVAFALVSTSSLEAAVPAHEPDRTDIASMYRFSECVVDHTRRGAEAVLTDEHDEEGYAKSLNRLGKGHETCLFAARIKMSGVLFAGSLAEVLLRKDHSQGELAGLLRAPEPPLEPRDAAEFTGLCMALEHPGETSALLYSAPESAQSDALIVQYAQLLPGCVRQGQQLHINKLGLRAIAALAAYRIADANSGARHG